MPRRWPTKISASSPSTNTRTNRQHCLTHSPQLYVATNLSSPPTHDLGPGLPSHHTLESPPKAYLKATTRQRSPSSETSPAVSGVVQPEGGRFEANTGPGGGTYRSQIEGFQRPVIEIGGRETASNKSTCTQSPPSDPISM
jgi:hypothetical protein